MSKILLNGGNGALGVYLTEELAREGHDVDVICLENAASEYDNVHYICHEGKDYAFLAQLLKNGYDAVVDFMIYPTPEEYYPLADLYLANTKHYLFLSTYRVYGGGCPITEETPRLWDMLRQHRLPEDFVENGEYSIYKAKEEDYLRSSGNGNFTIIRPAITFSKRRFQLTILEAGVLVHRMRAGKTVILPEEAMEHQGTLSWAGDFGKCVAGLILNEKAFGESYTVGTAEHHTWREIAEIYKKLEGLDYITVDTDTFIRELYNGSPYAKQQLLYDRCYDRVIDNRKITAITGHRAADFMPLEEGLRRELAAYDNSIYDEGLNKNMDLLLKKLQA